MKLTSQVWNAFGTFTFNTPPGVSRGWLTMKGAGAGGLGGGNYPGLGGYNGPGGGGGSAQGCFNLPISVSGAITVVVGKGGPGTDAPNLTIGGQATSFGSFVALPALDAVALVGYGGGLNGATYNFFNPLPNGFVLGLKDSVCYFSGSAGGIVINIGEGVNPYPSGGSGGYASGGADGTGSGINLPGGGGAATVRGVGGVGGDGGAASHPGVSAVNNGTGGGGASGPASGAGGKGGDGWDGYVAFFYFV